MTTIALAVLKRFAQAALFALGTLTAPAFAQDAEIVLMLGRGEVRDSAQSGWRPAAVRQSIRAGQFVRTLAGSQMALLLRDQTQVRLNENSVFQVTAVSTEGAGTTVNVLQGRVWAQAKQSVAGFLRSVTGAVDSVARVGRAPLRVQTPTATVGIRGTDWEVVVAEGSTTVTVLSGEVELSNNLGQIALAANEQGTVVAGQAPAKRLLAEARDRVQWVTAYKPAPRRWVPAMPPALESAARAIEGGDYAGPLAALEREARANREAALLTADLYLYFGRAGDAIALLQPRAAGDAMVAALLTRAFTIAGRLDEARRLAPAGAVSDTGELRFAQAAGTRSDAGGGARSGPARSAGDRELRLAQADLARLSGDATAALVLFLEVTRAYPQSHEAWFGVGRIEVERENVGAARTALTEALRLSPDNAAYLAERATLETLEGDLKAARASFEQALARANDDFLAHTGLGILQLRLGETQAALESFLRAGVIEPRFARSQLYVGVAYYQLGNHERAVEAVRKAAVLDPKDPLPHVMLSLMHGDAQNLRAASDAAREAQARMPFLKSLNQILNDQKGSANAGASLAAQGMEEWARSYATDAYNPYWAGSALFLADRLPSGFAKNSELYKGFLLDPTVFGAANRFSSLVAVPGHYGSIGARAQVGDFNQNTLIGAANGLSTAVVPFAYSLVAELADGHQNPDIFQARGGSFTVGLGARPTHALGLFYFGTHSRTAGHFSDSAGTGVTLPDDRLRQVNGRHDFGGSVRINATNQVLFKIGEGSQSTRLQGALTDTPTNTALATLLGPALTALFRPFTPRLTQYDADSTQTDIQLRHNFDIAPGLRFAWGVEHGEESRNLAFVRDVGHAQQPAIAAYRDAITPQRNFRSTDAYVSGRGRIGELVEMQVDVVHQNADSSSTFDRTQNFFGLLTTNTNTRERDSFSELNPRVGLRFSPAAGHNLRAVYQRWRRSVGQGTLGSVDTLGVPLEDRLVDTGGLMRKTRLQYDAQWGEATFVQVHAERREVNNIASTSAALFRLFGVTELDTLRSRRSVFAEPIDELERVPVFGEGEVSSFSLAANRLLSREFSIAARYTNASSRNTGPAFAGNAIPFVPTHYTNVSGFWRVQGRWLLGANATYRSARFSDEANTLRLNAGWAFGLRTYWETEDKRWSVEGVLANLHADKNSGVERRARFVLNSVYRF